MNLFILTTPLWIGIAAGVLFPFYGLLLSEWAFSLLLILGLLNTFPFHFSQIKKQSQSWKSLSLDLTLGYIFFPCLQMLFARYFVTDESARLGILLGSLAPVAIVAPQFIKSEQEKNFSILQILLSTLLYPLICAFYLKALHFGHLGLQIAPLIRDTLLLTLLPLALSYLAERFFPTQKNKIGNLIRKRSSIPNMTIIGMLVFIYFGSAFAKTKVSDLDIQLSTVLTLNALFQDFGVYALLHFFGFSEGQKVSLSLKNVALSGGVLLVFHPQAVLACSWIFVAHALFFIFLQFQLQKPKTLQENG